MQEKQLAAMAEQLIEIVYAAGESLMHIYTTKQSIPVTKKPDKSPVTEADYASNDVICKGLQAAYPDIPIISEESTQLAYEKRKSFSYYWLVDPLDGTREFINRTGEFTVNIALVENNRPVLGLVYAPVQNQLYVGYANTVYRRTKNGQQRLRAPSISIEQEDITIAVSRNFVNEQTKAFCRAYPKAFLLPCGSSLKFMLLAEGEAHIYPRFGTTCEWDTAAAQVILEAAGGQIVEAFSGEPLRYNKPDLRNPNFIAYGRRK